MRNYWSLLPAIAVCVVLIAIYAVPTLVNPQWTSNILGMFKQQPDGAEAVGPVQLGPKQVYSRRMLAGALVLGALALVGFNVSLNREANGCYIAAKAWGASDDKSQTADPCINMIYGNFIGDGSGEVIEKVQQPVAAYQLVRGHKPKYLKWIQNSPSYDETDFLVGIFGTCGSDVKVKQEDTRITVVYDAKEPCPVGNDISLLPIELKKPLGDREIVTVDGKPMKEINPDMDSWWSVLGKLATGG
ncbi:hypothetical protein [Kribbella qitaiheensis]|uniref:hypothetical protein n=1 Tax=Kribbella qitaiheensis TaxID=1544730 RepID=UPI001FE65E71|nr:hypothetical protein [Kribbella qitaiheensis]